MQRDQLMANQVVSGASPGGIVLVHFLFPPTSLAMSHPDGVSVSRNTLTPSPWKPASSILNHPAPEPSQELNAPAHLYIQTKIGPWLCVHWPQIADTLSPGCTVAFKLAEVPPLHRSFASVADVVGL